MMMDKSSNLRESNDRDPGPEDEQPGEKQNVNDSDSEPQLLEPEDALPPIAFEDLPERLRRAAGNAGWNSLMPVQARAIPYVLARRDLMIQSRTGTGKTGAYLLPILARINPELKSCQALVLVPTRELAIQVSRDALLLYRDSGIRSVLLYGGAGYRDQLEGLREGAQLVIGTPGRVLDHLMRRSLVLRDMHVLVFDEADRLMSMGFYPDMVQLRSYMPRQRTGYMFSATYPFYVRGLADQFLHKPGFLSLSQDTVHIADMEHIYYEVPPMDKDRALVRVIELENPPSAIIFCNTKDRVNYVATVLQRFGYDADQLTSELSQKARERVLERLRKGNLRFLVATDLAARGIDISGLSHVFVYEFPEDPESYVHRAGRTARAGAEGIAISIVSMLELPSLERAARLYKIQMEQRPAPTDQEVADVVSERVTSMLEAKLRSRDKLQTERMKRFMPLARNLVETEDELDVIAMLIDDFYHETLHAPVTQPEAPAVAEKPRDTGAGAAAGEPGGSSRKRRRRGRGRR